ncbi:MAG TPA: hypothetical protein VN231_03625, partial [Allosphingosinicella sp.]|nr:hypothetical protein [Allosphingosinicella sp.]
MQIMHMVGFRRSLLAAASVAGLSVGGQAAAQGVPDGFTPTFNLHIVTNHDVIQGPASVLAGINAPG